MSDQLASIFSSERDYEIGGKVIKIKDVTIGDIPVFLEIVNKLASAFDTDSKTDLKVGLVISKAIANEFDSVLKILQITTDLDSETIKKLNLAAATKITNEVVKQNLDFLHLHLVPALGQIKESFAGMKKSKS